MSKVNIIAFISLSACVIHASAGDVRSICEKTGLQIVSLKYRDQATNLKSLASTSGSKNAQLEFLKKENSSRSKSQDEIQKAVVGGNEKFIPDSKFKKLFLKFAAEKQKIANPIQYRQAVVDSINDLIPKGLNRLAWFLNWKASWIESTSIQPAVADEMGEMYGAVTRTLPGKDGKQVVEIVFSNNESEPLPYLIPLVVHELQHATTLESQNKIAGHERKVSFQLVDEAKAFDLQMQAYVALIKRDPELFCNWMYVTWAYGDIMVPLSWTMSAMEEEMQSGKYIFGYATRGNFAGEDHLLNATKTDLRTDLKKEIADLKLKYVK